MPLTDIRVVAHTPFTGKGAGHETVEANIKQLTAAVSLAGAEIKKLNDGPSVLPIFLAPEWTWKKKTDIYHYDDLNKIIAALLTLSKQHPEVLLFPGTILWSMPGKVEATEQKKSFSWSKFKFVVENLVSEKKVDLVYNTAPVFIGGNVIHFYHKQYEWHDTDEDAGQIFAFEPGVNKGGEFWKKFDGESSEISTAGDEQKPLISHVFTHAGLLFGIEIGADIRAGSLQKTGKKVDVQVLLSGGAAFVPNAMSTRHHGAAIHCDGNTRDPENKKFGLKGFTFSGGPTEPIPAATSRTYLGRGVDDRVVVLDDAIPITAPGADEQRFWNDLMKTDVKTLVDLEPIDFKHLRRTIKEASAAELKKVRDDFKAAAALASLQMRIFAAKRAREAVKPQTEWQVDKGPKDGSPRTPPFVKLMRALGRVIIDTHKSIKVVIDGLDSLNVELAYLGQYLAKQDPRLKWLQGPIKVSSKALGKTIVDYKADFSQNKDLVRGTLVALEDSAVKVALNAIEEICVPEFGLDITHRKEKKAEDAANNPCGYTDHNIGVQFNGYVATAEVQVASQCVLYGKQGKESLVKMNIFDSDKDYDDFAKKIGLQGGLGHALYDIWDKDKTGDDGIDAAALSKKYYDQCRMALGDSARGKLLKEVIAEIESFHPKTKRAQDLWLPAIAGH